MFLQIQQQSSLLGRRPFGFTEHYYTEWDDGLGKEKIALFLLISVGNTQVPSAEIAKEAFQLLQDHFLDDLTGDPYDRFETALREINHMVNEKERELEIKFIPNVHVLIGVLQKDMLFLSKRGDAEGYLVRKRHLSSITDGLYDEKNKEDLFQNIASGILEVGDNVIFTTGQLVEYVRPADVSKIFTEQSLEEATKELYDLLKDDLEDQMAMLSFEVLEKAVDDENGAVGGDTENVVAPKKIREVFEEAKDREERRRNRLKEALSTLRGFAEKKEFGLFLSRSLEKVQRLERRKLLAVIGGVALFVVLAIGVLAMTLNKQRTVNEMQLKLDMASSTIAQAETRGTFDKAAANVLLSAAEDAAVTVLDSGYLGAQASQILDDIKTQRDFLDNVVHVDDNLKSVVDLSGELGSEKILGLVSTQDKIELITQTRIFDVLTNQVQSPKTIDDAEKVIAARAFPDYNAIVLLTAGGKLIEYVDGNAQFADTASVTWNTGVDIATYGSKLYILDSSSEQIWKYQRGNTGYGSAQSYFPAGLDLSSAVSIAVDGNIWVLSSDGAIAKYLSGEKVDFTIKKAPIKAFEGASKIYTDLDSSKVYVLDSAAKRLLVYDKSSKNDDLTYALQYAFDDLKGNLIDFHVDKNRDVLMIATDTGLYEMEL